MPLAVHNALAGKELSHVRAGHFDAELAKATTPVMKLQKELEILTGLPPAIQKTGMHRCRWVPERPVRHVARSKTTIITRATSSSR
jgi:hypothetical protein